MFNDLSPVLPKNSRTIEGKRHIRTAPVKLCKSQNSKRSAHVSMKSAISRIRALEEIAAIFGPEEVTFHSIDDKVKALIGIKAANKQTALFMQIWNIKLLYQIMILLLAPNTS